MEKKSLKERLKTCTLWEMLVRELHADNSNLCPKEERKQIIGTLAKEWDVTIEEVEKESEETWQELKKKWKK